MNSNASRVGVSVLNWHLANWGYRFNDGKLIGPLWENMGFRDVPRREFLALLSDAVRRPGKIGRWQVETDSRPCRAGSRDNPGCVLPAVIDHVSHKRDFRNPPSDARMTLLVRLGRVSGRSGFRDRGRRHRMVGIGLRHARRSDRRRRR